MSGFQRVTRVRATVPVGRIGGPTASGPASFDTTEHPRIGFYYMLEDRDHGQQYLTVTDDLHY